MSGKRLILSLSKLDSIYTNDGLLAPTIDSAHNPLRRLSSKTLLSTHIRTSSLRREYPVVFPFRVIFGDPCRSSREVAV